MNRTLSVLAYNVYLRPTSLFVNGQGQRAERLPRQIWDEYDVVIFSEAFDDGARKTLLRGTAGAYLFTSRILGNDRGFEQDGGVVMVSRWPIVAQDQRTFASVCDGTDCQADKGVLYASIQKKGHRYHLFGSHTQAGSGTEQRKVDVRRRQFEMIRDFIAAQNIPAGEPVIIAGDLNVDKVAHAAECAAMLQTLDATHPAQVGPVCCSIDSRTNRLTEENKPPSSSITCCTGTGTWYRRARQRGAARQDRRAVAESAFNSWKYDLSATTRSGGASTSGRLPRRRVR
jgi:endonuclease/exonuclease/phosphatase family metal-dependent hydrolase